MNKEGGVYDEKENYCFCLVALANQFSESLRKCALSRYFSTKCVLGLSL